MGLTDRHPTQPEGGREHRARVGVRVDAGQRRHLGGGGHAGHPRDATVPAVARGKLITIEGIDGAGKSTLAQALARELAARGHRVELLREPGGVDVSERIRALVKDPALAVAPRAEALLYAAARAQLVQELLAPLLEQGTLVLLDRFVDSSLAYQGAGRELGVEEVRAINLFATGGLVPDRTLLLRIDPALGRARARERALEPDRLEREGERFFALDRRRLRRARARGAGANPPDRRRAGARGRAARRARGDRGSAVSGRHDSSGRCDARAISIRRWPSAPARLNTTASTPTFPVPASARVHPATTGASPRGGHSAAATTTHLHAGHARPQATAPDDCAHAYARLTTMRHRHDSIDVEPAGRRTPLKALRIALDGGDRRRHRRRRARARLHRLGARPAARVRAPLAALPAPRDGRGRFPRLRHLGRIRRLGATRPLSGTSRSRTIGRRPHRSKIGQHTRSTPRGWAGLFDLDLLAQRPPRHRNR